MLAESSTHFFLRDDPESITFEMNSEGDVDRMVIMPPDWLVIVAKKRP